MQLRACASNDCIRGLALQEDDLLRALVDRHGANKWTEIAASLPGRTGKSCRLR